MIFCVLLCLVSLLVVEWHILHGRICIKMLAPKERKRTRSNWCLKGSFLLKRVIIYGGMNFILNDCEMLDVVLSWN